MDPKNFKVQDQNLKKKSSENFQSSKKKKFSKFRGTKNFKVQMNQKFQSPNVQVQMN